MPSPIIGGVLAILCGIITAVGISIIKFVNLNNTRNLFIVGVSTFCGLSFPAWFKDHPEQINFGSEGVNRFMSVLIRNPMFMTGLLAFVMDNTIGGASDEDRGISNWINLEEEEEEARKDGDVNNNSSEENVARPTISLTTRRVYGLPKHCQRLQWIGNWFPLCLPKWLSGSWLTFKKFSVFFRLVYKNLISIPPPHALAHESSKSIILEKHFNYFLNFFVQNIENKIYI